MTTPDERLRAVRLGKELLACIQEDAVVALQTRELAASLLRSYPEGEDWSALDAEVIFETAALFESVARTGKIGPESSFLWPAVMRRYPGPRDVLGSAEQIRRVLRSDRPW